MSYDLYFYKKKNSSLTEESFADYLTKNLKSNISDNSNQWIYENPETAVCFWFDWNEPNTEEEDTQLFDKFENFTISILTLGLIFLDHIFLVWKHFQYLKKSLKTMICGYLIYKTKKIQTTQGNLILVI